MLRDDGKVVFLDFGLMSRVDPDIMEAFAQGIRACLAEDYEGLSKAFQDSGFLTTPLRFREDKTTPYGEAPGGLAQFAGELRDAMAATEGGTSRFGALAEVLNGILSKRWKMFTPPYAPAAPKTSPSFGGHPASTVVSLHDPRRGDPHGARRERFGRHPRNIRVAAAASPRPRLRSGRRRKHLAGTCFC